MILIHFKHGPLDGTSKLEENEEIIQDKELGLCVILSDDRYAIYHRTGRKGIAHLDQGDLSCFEYEFASYATDKDLELTNESI